MTGPTERIVPAMGMRLPDMGTQANGAAGARRTDV